ncbi:MAG: DUF4911 domain-containing protein [Desulfobacterales bacterium]|nr:DUF4911 domain-containing protein [Desulfobacterales bacterium]
MPNATIRRYYRIDRRKIYYLKFILEGYDGVAVMRTVDPQKGLVVLHISPGCEGEIDMIIRDLQDRVAIKIVEIAKKGAS